MATRRTNNSRNSRNSARRRTNRRKPGSNSVFQKLLRQKYEFKPDAKGTSWLKKLYLTKLQRMNLLKWSLYAALCVFLLVIQDVIMSRISIFGATTDLAPMVILLITVLLGSEYGSTFVLIASTLYWFSGSAPGAYVIALLCFVGIFATLLRQLHWRRGLGSTVITAGCALVIYELCIFLAGILLGLTHWGRIGIFILTALLSWIIMVPLYPLTYKIGQIGGEPWKE